jgi:HEAT repeats
MRARRIFLFAVAGAAALAAIVLLRRSAQPICKGHSLSKWVAVLHDASPGERAFQRAVEAVGHIGTNATPFLLAWIQFEPKPGPFRSTLSVTPMYNWGCGRLSLRDRLLYEFRTRRERDADGAGAAFGVLGARAAPAIPELTRLMNGRAAPLTAFRAALALAYLGTNGLAPLLAAINDPEHQNRFEALAAIDAMPDPWTPPADPVVPHIILCLGDVKDKRVAPAAAYALRRFGSVPELVIPALTNCLNSTNGLLRRRALQALSELGQHVPGRPAVAALPALTNALSDPDPSVRMEARSALDLIASEVRRNAPAH